MLIADVGDKMYQRQIFQNALKYIVKNPNSCKKLYLNEFDFYKKDANISQKVEKG